MNEKIDEGNIVSQRLFNISEADTLFGVYERCHRFLPEMMEEVIKNYEDNKKAVPNKKGTYYSWPRKKDIIRFYKEGYRTI